MRSTPKRLSDKNHFESNHFDSSYDIQSNSNEHEETWFLGSLIKSKKSIYGDFNRCASLHNQITKEETQFDGRYQANQRVASQLAEFFPLKWMQEITSNFRKINAVKLGVKSFNDRVYSYLGYIEILLTFRGLTLLDSTLFEINNSLGTSIKKHGIQTWKIKLLHLIPELREQWIYIRAQTHKTAFISTVIKIMNRELKLTECSRQEIFLIKQTALLIAREFIATPKGKHIKKPEIWARAICLKALRMITPDYGCLPFPNLTTNTIKVVENKRWQLDRLLSFPPLMIISESS